MARLFGAQRLVLQAIQDAQGETSAFLEDNRIAQATKISLKDMRDWFLTLEQDEYVDLALTEGGLKASISPKGRLAQGRQGLAQDLVLRKQGESQTNRRQESPLRILIVRHDEDFQDVRAQPGK